jgi:hypothetical protein
MAQRLREALDSGAPPSTARLPMTPEEAAAAYGHSTGPRAGEAPGASRGTAGGRAAASEPGGHDDQDENLPPRAAGRPPATQRQPQDPGPALQ